MRVKRDDSVVARFIELDVNAVVLSDTRDNSFMKALFHTHIHADTDTHMYVYIHTYVHTDTDINESLNHADTFTLTQTESHTRIHTYNQKGNLIRSTASSH